MLALKLRRFFARGDMSRGPNRSGELEVPSREPPTDPAARMGHRWATSATALRSVLYPTPERLGCVAVRRVADDLGREWRVRELWSATGHALLFQCEVPGVRSEVRPVRSPMESLSDDDLAAALVPVED
jgi:hypothetical protein